MTQCEQILAHLRKSSLTPIDALNNYGVFRLAARVAELRAAGHDVVTIRESQGEKTFARYQLRASRD